MNVCALVGIVIGALVVAVLAALILSPDQGPPTPDPSAAERVIDDRFTPDELSRAESYRHKGRLIAIASLFVQFGTLAFLAFWRGGPARRLLTRLDRHPLRGALIAGAGITVLLSLVGLPLDLAAWQLGRDHGLVTQPLGPRLVDWLLATLVAVIPAAIGALAAMAMWRRLKGKFWIGAGLLVAVWAVTTTWLWPVVVSPLFNDFEPLPAGPARAEVIRLADRAGVEVGEVYEVDASRRSSTLNAYVNGIGSSKRVVIYDNATRELSPSEFSALVAHELGHVESGDMKRGLAFALLVIPLAVLFVQISSGAILRRNADDAQGPAVIFVLALVVTVAMFVLQVPGNALSRNIESKADRYALALTGEPEGLVDLQVGLAKANLSDVDPPALWHFLFGTHPSAFDRIARAEGARNEG